MKFLHKNSMSDIDYIVYTLLKCFQNKKKQALEKFHNPYRFFPIKLVNGTDKILVTSKLCPITNNFTAIIYVMANWKLKLLPFSKTKIKDKNKTPVQKTLRSIISSPKIIVSNYIKEFDKHLFKEVSLLRGDFDKNWNLTYWMNLCLNSYLDQLLHCLVIDNIFMVIAETVNWILPASCRFFSSINLSMKSPEPRVKASFWNPRCQKVRNQLEKVPFMNMH